MELNGPGMKKSFLAFNSIFLMLNVLSGAVLGAAFWWVAARLFASETVGSGIILISMAQLLTTTAQFGMNFGLIRFLAEARDKSSLLGTAFTFCLILAAVLGMLTVLLGPRISTSLASLNHGLTIAGIFVLLVATLAAYQLSYPVMVALDKPDDQFLLNLFVLASRIALLAFLARAGSPAALLSAYVLPMLLADLFLVIAYLPKKVPGFQPVPRIHSAALGQIAGYSIASYFGNILHDFPSLLLPQIVANFGGLSSASYFYYPWSFFGLIVTVSNSISQSLFVEGSNRLDSFRRNTRKATWAALGIASAGALVLYLFCYPILSIFGPEYARQGSTILRILCLSSIPASFVYNRVAVLRVHKNVTAIIFTYGLIVAICLFLLFANPLLHNMLWLTLSWLISQIIAVPVIASFANARRFTGQDDG